MKKAKTQNLKTQRKRREQRFLGVVKRWQIIIPGPKKASLPLLFPACLHAPRGLCGEGFLVAAMSRYPGSCFCLFLPLCKKCPEILSLKRHFHIETVLVQ